MARRHHCRYIGTRLGAAAVIPRWGNLNDVDRSVFRAATAFLTGRLEQRATVEWALGLQPNAQVKRGALLDLIDGPQGGSIREPWRTAWRLIEESWESQPSGDSGASRAYYIGQRLAAGDRSGVLATEVSELVAPRLTVKPFTEWELLNRKPPKRPRSIEQLFSARLTSAEVVDPRVLHLDRVEDVDFLVELANRLDAKVVGALDLAARVGWNTQRRSWQVGPIHRVYYVPESDRPAGQHEPDEFHRGIVASVKLLHFVVFLLVALDTPMAIAFAQRWRASRSSLHARLWSALARDSRIASGADVAAALLSMDDSLFWNQNINPEIAELRALRFGGFSPSDQAAILARLCKLPPRAQWPRDVGRDRLRDARLFWAIRELRRIEITGATLPVTTQKWLASRIPQFPELRAMSRVDDGFMGTAEAQQVVPESDARYDLLVGSERLGALEVALSSPRVGWDDDPAQRASHWIGQQGNVLLIIGDFESASDPSRFPQVWDRFGWTHSPTSEPNAEGSPRELPAEATRVLSLLAKLSESTIGKCIEGVAHWLSVWRKQVVALQDGPAVWHMVWPIAVEATNEKAPAEDPVDLQVVMPSEKSIQRMDIDTLNTPAGKLVEVFLAGCPRIEGSDRPFATDGALAAMRDKIIGATGRAGLIAKHRLVEGVAYFLRADPNWTEHHLIHPLTTDDVEALALWHAIGRHTQFTEVLQVIGGPMTERAVDMRGDRETRRSLVFSLIVECLHALKDNREPAVPYPRIQQMIRSLDDEVRAYGASAVKRFVRDISARTADVEVAPAPEEVFRSAAKPFLQGVWPQERSLSTPGVSRALAELPAVAREAFVEAVDVVDRFLVPFECWSMLEYGLYGEEDGEPKLSNIDNEEKAAAFLRLLDHTIGNAEGAVIPLDLGDALDQIHRVAPTLRDSPLFRRLAAAARRGP
jgi:hypothetical protein